MNTMQRNTLLPLILCSALFLHGCDITGSGSGNEHPGYIENLTALCATSDGIVDIDIYTKDVITTRYTRLFFDVFESGTENRITEFDFAITPVMNMGEHVHAAPAWQPDSSRDPDSGMFEGAIIPTMPGGETGAWTLQWDAGNSAAGEPCDMEVGQASNVKVFTADNDERYILTWIHPHTPVTGANAMTLSLHRRESMMSFPEVQDMKLEIRTWMNSMDHGSEGSVHPGAAGDGFYEGSVVFNMSGDWQVFVTMIEDGKEIYEAEFELQVK